ncbi:integrase, catalytic region, zinc finger, CCHC-type containing protein [Tanacetum coccineum]
MLEINDLKAQLQEKTIANAEMLRFGNDQFAPILRYRDLVQGNVTIKRIYYVEGLNHNLFSVGQASIDSTWLWHHRLSHLNFDTINMLFKNDIVNSLTQFETKRKFATDLEICIFTLPLSTDEAKNIKEAMVDHAWIEAMQEELHQFDRLSV